MRTISRRGFVRDSFIGATGLAILPLIKSCSGKELDYNPVPFPLDDSRHWYERPLRILQTVLREPDGKNYDAASVAGYMKKTRSNVLVVNAGGIIDFFKNPLPAANPNRFFTADDDVLRDITAACHAEGMKVIARVDFRGVKKEIYEQYPGWFARDANGNPLTLTYTRYPLYIPCYDSYYRNEHAMAFVDYLFREYNIDGIWHNSVHVGASCYCDRCAALYRDAYQLPLPVQGKSSKREMDRYFEWKTTRASNHMQTIRAGIKKFGEDKAYAAEVFGMYDVSLPIQSGIDLYSARDHFDFLVSVNFLTENRREIEYKNLGYSAGIIRFLKALDPAKEAVILFGQNGTSHRYIMEPDIDSRIFLWEAIASGGGIWNCSFTGQHPGATHDRRNAMLIHDAYRFIEEQGSYFSGLIPSSDLTIYYSRPTRIRFGSDNHNDDRFGTAIQGIERMCRDNHLQYSFLPDESLSAENLENVKVLALPDVASMSDAEAEVISHYVRNGGNLIASFETSLYDHEGNIRNDFALAGLFGCSYSGIKTDTRMDCYQWINDHQSPVLSERMQDTHMLINNGETLLCNVISESATTVCSYIPRIINQSPEMAWLPENEMVTDHPTVLVNNYGKGRVVYFANQPDRMNHLMGHGDFDELLYGAVSYLLERKPLLSTSAPSSVHIWASESPEKDNKRYVVSAVNATGGYERPLRSLSAVYNIEINLVIPGIRKFQSRVLRKEGDVKISRKADSITIKIDKLEEFASFAIFT